MLALIRAFFDIALHRRGPEELPASGLLFGAALAAYLAAAGVSLSQPMLAVLHPVLLLAMDTALTLGFIWALLKTFAHERRFRQTATAFFGTAALFNVLGTPIAIWYDALRAAEADIAMPAILLVLLLVWMIDVGGFILSRAIGRPYVLAIGIMLGYELLTYSVRVALFPPLNLPPTT